MEFKLLQGKKISEKILDSLRNKIKKEKIKPALAVILVGDNKASQVYVSLKEKAAEKVGIGFVSFRFKSDSAEKDILKKIKEINSDKKISGLIVQLPLPKKFATQKIIDAIDPRKDVDGFHPENLKLFLKGESDIFPVFPKAIMRILESIETRHASSVRNKKSVVIANSKIFGETMLAALRKKGIKAEYILTGKIKNNLAKIKQTDILITALGQPGLITGEMVKKGVIVVDGGITKKGKKVLGDVDFVSSENKASYITPVPGGVGPVTIACLLENVYLAAKKSL